MNITMHKLCKYVCHLHTIYKSSRYFMEMEIWGRRTEVVAILLACPPLQMCRPEVDPLTAWQPCSFSDGIDLYPLYWLRVSTVYEYLLFLHLSTSLLSPWNIHGVYIFTSVCVSVWLWFIIWYLMGGWPLRSVLWFPRLKKFFFNLLVFSSPRL